MVNQCGPAGHRRLSRRQTPPCRTADGDDDCLGRQSQVSRGATRSLAKGSKKPLFSPTMGTQSLLTRFIVAILVGVAVMLDLLLNHSPAFLVGELMLGLSLAMFGVALAEVVRDKYAIRVPAKTRD
jgi:F0F1-type ATP synthase assembly protein I